MEPEILVEKITALEEREKSNTKRINRLEDIVENIRDLTASVQLLASKQDDMNKVVEKLDRRMGAVEAEPGKKWKAVVEKALTVLVAAVIGFALAKIGF